MKTAVEWLRKELEEIPNYSAFYTNNYDWVDSIMNEALAMEKEQMKIYQIDKELFKKLPIEGVNCTSFNVNEHRYFATKYYIDNFKDNFKPKSNEEL
jgi:hypothetical protein